MYAQDDPFFNPISDAGCYAISLANLCEKYLGKPVDKLFLRDYLLDEVLDRKSWWIDMDMTVLSANGVLQKLGCPLVQKMNDGSVEFPADYQCAIGEYEILKFQYTSEAGTTFSHFVLGDGSGKCSIDPLSYGSNSVKKGKVVSKRIFGLLVK